MITTRDDDLVRSHDEALQVLRYAAPGVDVRTYPVASPGTAESATACRRYELLVPRLGGLVVSAADLYHLPTRAAGLTRRARELAEAAWRS